jgi:MFS family permease
MHTSTDRLFTPRFFLMCGFSFTVFLSAFQLFPTAPFHIRDLGGSTFAAGLFLACLTFASAVSAPFTGALADRVGLRRTLITSGLAITLCAAGYAWLPDYRLMLGLTVVHGLFWSGLLTASAAYMSSILPASRRAEGISYWGLSSVVAMAVGPTMGFWVYHHGWVPLCLEMGTLNLTMAIIAWRLPDERLQARHTASEPHVGPIVEWRCYSTHTATAPSRVSPRCTPNRTVSLPEASTSARSAWRSSRRGRFWEGWAIGSVTCGCSCRVSG